MISDNLCLINLWQIQEELMRKFNFYAGVPKPSTLATFLRKDGFKQKVTHVVNECWNYPRTLEERVRFADQWERLLPRRDSFIFVDEQSWTFHAHR